MIIDFNNIKEQEIPNFKGGEGVAVFNMYQDETNKIFKVVLAPNCSVGFHKHEKSQEIMYLLEGEILAIDDDKEVIFKQGQVHVCKDGHSHSIINKSAANATLICSVTNL